MRYVRKSRNPNIFVGLILVLLLAVFAGPSTLPRLLSNVIPQFYEGVPCAWLRTATDRAFHQSLLGRSAVNPFSMSVQSTSLPADGSGSLLVNIVITNNALGTVPFVYDPLRVIVGDNGTSGLGVIFSPPNSLSAGAPRQDTGIVAEENLRLLGPRQSCVVTVEFPAGNVLPDPSVANGAAQVRSYYRNNNSGQIGQPANTLATPIYRDQGLWTGYVESANVPIPLASQ
ncbi:MAG: hypothetical protein ABI835_17600 [Chloroflexota bacterium]